MITATPMWRVSRTLTQLAAARAHLDLLETEGIVKVTIRNVSHPNGCLPFAWRNNNKQKDQMEIPNEIWLVQFTRIYLGATSTEKSNPVHGSKLAKGRELVHKNE